MAISQTLKYKDFLIRNHGRNRFGVYDIYSVSNGITEARGFQGVDCCKRFIDTYFYEEKSSRFKINTGNKLVNTEEVPA